MTCSQVLELVEAIASGDAAVDDVVRDHLETCPRCASALAAARRLEAMLAARPAPSVGRAFIPPRARCAFSLPVLSCARHRAPLTRNKEALTFNLRRRRI